MEANRKRAKVYRLPTKEITNVLVNTYIDPEKHSQSPVLDIQGRNKVYLESKGEVKTIESRGFKFQHLYFTTDEEIKEGDWCLKPIYKGGIKIGYGVLQADSSYFGGYGYDWEDHHKIIATTDPKLYTEIDNGFEKSTKRVKTHLPQPTQAFIKAYCKQDGIDEVDVEYITGFDNCNDPNYFCKLKVDPIHNTITTHRVIFNRRDDLLRAICIYTEDSISKALPFVEEWIKDNPSSYKE